MYRLPPEIIREKCTNLCCHCYETTVRSVTESLLDQHRHRQGKKALFNLCLTTSWLCDIARPVLYHRLFFNPSTENRVVPALKTLIALPGLAKNVKHLGLGGIFFDRNSMISDEDCDFIEQAALAEGISLPYWYPDPVDANVIPQVMTAFFVLHVPSVSAMYLGGNPDDLFDDTLAANLTPSSLSQLRTLVLCALYLGGCEPILHPSSNLSCLYWTCCGSFISKTLSISNISKLILANGSLSLEDLNLLLSSFKNLKQVSSAYERGDGLATGINDVVRALRQNGHDKTLHTLGLSKCLNSRQNHSPHGITTLENFSHLQHISLGADIINQSADGAMTEFSTSLSPSMVSITFSGEAENIIGDLHGITEIKIRGKLPELRSFTFTSKSNPVSVTLLNARLDDMGIRRDSSLLEEANEPWNWMPERLSCHDFRK